MEYVTVTEEGIICGEKLKGSGETAIYLCLLEWGIIIIHHQRPAFYTHTAGWRR